jgi:hypothetical protein
MTMKRLTASPAYNVHGESLTDLSIIGVPTNSQKQLPTLSGYPRKFSPDALPVWTKMLQDPIYRAETRNQDNMDLAWHETIVEFLKRCEAEGVMPFANNTETTKNEYVFEFVNRARIALVKYYNEVGFFQRVKVRKAFREYVRKDSGLIIRSWANLYTVKDMEFEKWLTRVPLPRFHKGVDNRFTRMIEPHIMGWVRYLNPANVTCGFEIEVAGTVNIPGKKVPKRKELNAWLDRTIWLPIVRAHRFDGVNNRLF